MSKMDPEQPKVMYGRYYYGQEAIIRNDDSNIQLHRTETSGHIRDAQPFDSFRSRRMHAIGLESASHNNGVRGPSIGNFQGYGSVNNSSSLSGRYEQTGASHYNGLSNARDCSFEWNRQNYHIHGRQPPNFLGSEIRPVSFAAASDFERLRPISFAGVSDFERQRPISFASALDFERQPPSEDNHLTYLKYVAKEECLVVTTSTSMILGAPVLFGTDETTIAMKVNQSVRRILGDDNPIHVKVKNNRPYFDFSF